MRDNPPSISVIVPAYGVAHLLGEALRSLQNQDFDDWEAIVVDDGAPDDVAGALAPFADDPRIRLLQTDNGGLATARNRAIAVARSPFVCLLDGDDLYEPGYLSTMLKTIEADPRAGFATCDAAIFGGRSRAGRLFSHLMPQQPPVTLERVLSRKFNIFVGCTIRRAALDAVGGFNGALRSAEDLDLWLRLLEADWLCVHVPRPLVRYRRRADSLSANTTSLLRWTAEVYRNAVVRLRARPEAATARAVLAQLERQQHWIEGEALIRAGRPHDGVAMLTDAKADERSLRWRIAMPIMRRAPWLAPRLIDMRYWLP